jgi:S1-C subfamily serine protease
MTLPPGDHESPESVPSSPTGTGPATRLGMRALVVAVVAVVFVGVATGLALTHANQLRLGNGVVVIETNLGYEDGAAAGTGMVLSSSGEVLTNNHVIKGATTIRVVVPGTGRSYTAKVVGYDVSDDVAVLQAQHASNLKTIPLGDSSQLTAGEAVTALGNAGGTGRLTAAKGTITGLGKTITASDGGSTGEVLNGLLETDAGVEPGDSGGPLLNEAGQAIGMDTAASTGSRFASETGNDAYAIPIGKALSIAKQIESGERSTDVHIGGTAFLGIEVQPGDTGYGYGGYGSSEAAGAQIASVVTDAPAAAAGLEAGDVITAIDGRAISSASEVTSVLLTEQPGMTVPVAYVDPYGTSQTTSVTLATGPAQ